MLSRRDVQARRAGRWKPTRIKSGNMFSGNAFIVWLATIALPRTRTVRTTVDRCRPFPRKALVFRCCNNDFAVPLHHACQKASCSAKVALRSGFIGFTPDDFANQSVNSEIAAIIRLAIECARGSQNKPDGSSPFSIVPRSTASAKAWKNLHLSLSTKLFGTVRHPEIYQETNGSGVGSLRTDAQTTASFK